MNLGLDCSFHNLPLWKFKETLGFLTLSWMGLSSLYLSGCWRCVTSAVLVLLLSFGLIFDLVIFVNQRGIDHGRPGPHFFGEGFTSSLPELPFSLPRSLNSCAPDYNMLPICVYPPALCSTNIFDHCLLLLVHAIVSWCPFS
jgi:hypothetical protein